MSAVINGYIFTLTRWQMSGSSVAKIEVPFLRSIASASYFMSDSRVVRVAEKFPKLQSIYGTIWLTLHIHWPVSCFQMEM